MENETGNITRAKWQTVYKNIECALSTGNNPTNQTETVNNIQYNSKIFLAPEIQINPGDKIAVNRLGKKELLFESAGEAAVYETHQEIMVKRSDWA